MVMLLLSFSTSLALVASAKHMIGLALGRAKLSYLALLNIVFFLISSALLHERCSCGSYFPSVVKARRSFKHHFFFNTSLRAMFLELFAAFSQVAPEFIGHFSGNVAAMWLSGRVASHLSSVVERACEATCAMQSSLGA